MNWSRRALALAPLFLVLSMMGAAAGPRPGWPALLRIVYLPVTGEAATLQSFQPLTNHLAASLALPVRASSAGTYDEIIIALGRDQFDLAYLSASAYARAAKRSKLEVIAMELDREGRRGYHSVIVCRADRPYATMEDGRGKVLAFTNPDSASGFQVPLHHFIKERKETPGSYASRVVMAGDHLSVIEGVNKGDYDLGATNTIDLERAAQEKGIPLSSFKVLWQSQLIPGSPICAQSDLPPDFKNAIVAALLAFNSEKEKLNSMNIGGFAPATAQDYEIFLELEP